MSLCSLSVCLLAMLRENGSCKTVYIYTIPDVADCLIVLAIEGRHPKL
jgi:hypothetical protein